MRYWLMNKSISRYIPVYPVLLFIPLLLSLLTSCKKDSGLGSDVLPPAYLLSAYVTDTTTVVSSIKLKDSILTNSVALYQIGNYFDPVFGMTKASLYTQVLLPGNGIDYTFGSGTIKLDSVVLDLPFSSPALYGYASAQTFIVDTLDSNLVTTHSYYSDTAISHSSKHIGYETITPDPYDWDSIDYGGEKASLPPALRIKLDTNFGKYIMNANSSYFQTSVAFSGLLKGLYVWAYTPGQLPGQGGIMYLNPNLAGTGLTFYYKLNGTPQYPQTFLIGSSAVYFNHFDHDYSTTSFYVKGKDSVLSPDVAYIQATAGVKTQLSFPFLSNWKKLGHIVVNKAEVLVPVNVSATGSDIPPAQAYLVRDSAGHEFTLSDQTLNTYGGTYDATNHLYDFNIARYIQAVVDGKIEDTGLYLVAGSSAITANGAVLYGTAKNGNSPRIRLKIYYTPITH